MEVFAARRDKNYNSWLPDETVTAAGLLDLIKAP